MKINVSKASIHYHIIGQGIPVVLLHGFALDMHVMKGAYEPIFTRLDGFKRIYIDLPAMGDSKAKADLKTSQDLVDTLLEFVDKVIGREKFLLIGQSYGGYLAQALLTSIPSKTLGLALLCPLVIADDQARDLPDRKIIEDQRQTITFEDKEDFEDYLDFAVMINQGTFDRYKTDLVPGFNKATSPILEIIRQDNYALRPEPYQSLQSYDKPSLILVGKQDAAVGYKDVLRLDPFLTNLSLGMINGSGHCLQYEQEDIFNTWTLQWLKIFI